MSALTIQGFVTITQFINNTPNVIHPFGEISTHSLTYSKEKGFYSDTSIPGYTLISFQSVTSLGQNVVIPTTQARQVLDLVRAVVAYAVGHSRPYDEQDFLQTIQTQFQAEVQSLGFGPLVNGGSIALPSFLIWNNISTGNSIRVWLADEAFQNQFTGYEITTITPIDNLDDFFLPYTQVKALLDAISVSQLVNKIQVAKNMHPDTVTHVLEFDFYNRYDTQVKTTCRFGVLVYGQEGDYIDTMKDAIVEHLLSNSSFGPEQWQQVLPDLFKRTEMIILPRWSQLAIENLTEQSSLYSSVTSPHQSLVTIGTILPDMSASWIQNNTYTLPFPLKTLMAYVVNGQNNEVGRQDFKQLFPDYLPIPSTSLDFARMTLSTQNWVLFIDDLLLAAETATLLSNLPQGIRRVRRNNRLYVAKLHDRVNYLVLAKSNGVF